MDIELWKFFLEGRGKVGAHIIGRGDITAKNNRMESLIQPIFKNEFRRGKFLVILEVGQGLQLKSKGSERLTLGAGPVLTLEELGRGVVALKAELGVPDGVLRLLFNYIINRRLILISDGRQVREPGFEHLNTGGRARHNAAQECQRGPILDPFMAASFMVRSDQLAGKFDDFFKKRGVFLPQLVKPFKGLAFGERGFLFRRPFGHICPLALHKESSQFSTLRLIGIGQVEKFEILAQQSEEGMEFLGFAAVGSGGEQDEMLIRFAGNTADKVVALLLTVRCAGRACAGMGLINDDQFRALFDEDISPVVGLDKIDADDLIGVIIVNAGVALDLPVEAGLGVGADDDGFYVKLVSDLRLPLFAEVGQANDGESFNSPTLQHFLGNEQCFDGLADTDIIGNQ